MLVNARERATYVTRPIFLKENPCAFCQKALPWILVNINFLERVK